MPLPSRIRATIQRSKKAKRRPDNVGTPFALKVVQLLEDDFYRKLHVEGFTWTKARRARVIADGVAHQAEPVGSRASPVSKGRCQKRVSLYGCSATTAHSSDARGQVDPVEEVKHIRAELDLDPLGNRDVLDN